MKSLIPTFRDSVLTPSTGLVGEWTEIGIDALIQNDILTINEQIPKNAQKDPITAKKHFEQGLPVKHNY